jgi:hypothetical protein
MTEKSTRAESYAAQFEAAMDDFTRLVELLTDEQWRRVGANHPQRMNDEDEQRPVGVIAYHVAATSPLVIDRIRTSLEGRQLPPLNFKTDNARQAEEHAGAGRDEVLALLRETRGPVAEAIRSFTDEQLDQATPTAVGAMTVAQRIEAVLIGHIKTHQGSIEAAIAP